METKADSQVCALRCWLDTIFGLLSGPEDFEEGLGVLGCRPVAIRGTL